MSPPIRDGSGSSIGNIRLGDGSEISEVRTGSGDVLFSASAIPDSAGEYLTVGTRNGGTINQWDLTTKYDISSRTNNQTVSTGIHGGLCYNNDGSKFYIINGSQNLEEYSLSINYDITTRSLNSTWDDGQSGEKWVTFNPDGTLMYIQRRSFSEVEKYSLSSPFDISNRTSEKTTSFNVDSMDITWSSDGTKFFLGTRSGGVKSFSAGSAFDIGNLSSIQSTSLSGVNQTKGLTWKYDGTKFVACGESNNVQSFSVGSAFDISNVTQETQFGVSGIVNTSGAAYAYASPY